MGASYVTTNSSTLAQTSAANRIAMNKDVAYLTRTSDFKPMKGMMQNGRTKMLAAAI
jgi:hypothetical protein